MKFRLDFERVYPHQPAQVWKALTHSAALAEWLMKNDFEPVEGRTFSMWCKDGKGGTATYSCKLLSYNPPHRMLWSWTHKGIQEQNQSFVEFFVEAAAGGTKLKVVHHGDLSAEDIEKFKGGWPARLELIEGLIGQKSRSSTP